MKTYTFINQKNSWLLKFNLQIYYHMFLSLAVCEEENNNPYLIFLGASFQMNETVQLILSKMYI